MMSTTVAVAKMLRDIGIEAQRRGNELNAMAPHLKPEALTVNEIRTWAMWDLAAVLTEGTRDWIADDE